MDKHNTIAAVDEAIRARIDRFNRLWINATGHSFEEDPEFCKQECEREEKRFAEGMKDVLEKYGFSNYDQYDNSLELDYENSTWTNRIPEIDLTARRLNKKSPSSLYEYEMFVINEAKRLYEFVVESMPEGWWDEFVPGKSCIDISDELKRHGFAIGDEHSANTFYTMFSFTDCLFRTIELFPYLHGSLCSLVGDEGYHDDRSDLPERVKS